MLLLLLLLYLLTVLLLLLLLLVLLLFVFFTMKYDNDAHQDHNKKMVTKYRWIGAPYLSNMYYKYLAKSAVYERLEAIFTLTKTMQWMRQGP